MKKRRIALIAVFLLAVMLLTACAEQKTDGEDPAAGASPAETQQETANPVPVGYRQITQEEAQKMMQEESGYIILDVRTPEEFAEGHIPGAICISHDSIPTDEIPELPDKDQLIMIYCRSGRRSKLAAEQLVKQGYTNVVEFGGFTDWTGETTTDTIIQ